jgi:hypothetical protein
MMMNIIIILVLVYSLLAHSSEQQPNQVHHPFMLKLLLNGNSVTSEATGDYSKTDSSDYDNLYSGYVDKSDRDIRKASDKIDDERSINSNNINSNIEMSSEAQILSTVFIGVTTTGRYHKSRLDPILETWHPGLADRTWFFTDTPDPALAAAVGENHLLVLPHCGSDHSRDALACKMEAQLAAFLDSPPTGGRSGQSPAAWFCHVDDDNYVNRRTLAGLLGRRNGHTEDWYLGKASVPEPLELPPLSASPSVRRFWFATGGAGFCLSRHLAERMRPWIVDGRFRQLANAIRLPDDVTVGYLVEVLLGGRLTHVAALHSHLERLEGLGPPELAAAITLSYGRYEDTGAENVVAVEGVEEEGKEDRTRFRAVHCRLRPTECRRPLG